LHLLRGLGVDHVGIVGRNLVVQRVGRMGQEGAMLLNPETVEKLAL
jgi:hypothetical protein